jgi:hypothetical protein
MLEQSLYKAHIELLERMDSVCQTPGLPAELAEDLKNVVWRLVYHYSNMSHQWSLLNALGEEFVKL